MPLNDERPGSTSSGEDQGSDGESSCERRDSVTSSSEPDVSRESFTSDCSSKPSTPSSSPPKDSTLEEVMEFARVLSNFSLAHEINVNPDFRPTPLPDTSLNKVVRDIVHKAFWDVLESELNDDPPEYGQAIRLLEEIREILLSFLEPGANRMRTQILEVLDLDLIRQQVDNDSVDIQGLASYIITTMGKLCAPVRDQDIKKLRESPDDIVTLFREIFRVLDLMKADMVNILIIQLRPVLQRHGVEYEREAFQRIVDASPTALTHTTSWIKSALDDLVTSMPKNKSSDPGKGQPLLPGPFLILNNAFVRILLTSDDSKSPLPETWLNDEGRLRDIQWQLQRCQAVNQVLLIINSTVGGAVQDLPSLSDRLKRMISVLLEGMHTPGFNLEEALKGVSAQMCCEINKSLTERKFPALTSALQETLSGQILSITKKDNPIRTLVEDRVLQYFVALVFDPKPQLKLDQVPAGLTAIKPELAALGAKFISLVNYNRSVYGSFYADIIRKLMLSGISQSAADAPRDATKDSVTSN